ncbi:MAG: flavodoxin domain-containing protein [Candidatus Hermodarchaeia archaeon]|jgi:menaquinone-dependent protoporphyrinogen oxidase
MNTLIVYGTRFGATGGTSEEIAKVLRNEGFDVKVVNAKKEKVKDITEYELVIVASGMRIGRWTKESENFLGTFSSKLANKKLALFVSSAPQIIYEHQNDEEKKKEAWTKYLIEKTEKYGLTPIAMAIFGGWVNPDNMGWLDKRMGKFLIPELKATGVKEVDGVYDTRDWDAIRNWAKELAQLVRE